MQTDTGMSVQTCSSQAVAMSLKEKAEVVLLIGDEILWSQLPGIKGDYQDFEISGNVYLLQTSIYCLYNVDC